MSQKTLDAAIWRTSSLPDRLIQLTYRVLILLSVTGVIFLDSTVMSNNQVADVMLGDGNDFSYQFTTENANKLSRDPAYLALVEYLESSETVVHREVQLPDVVGISRGFTIESDDYGALVEGFRPTKPLQAVVNANLSGVKVGDTIYLETNGNPIEVVGKSISGVSAVVVSPGSYELLTISSMPFANVKLKWTGEDNYDQVLDVISKAQSGLPRELLIPTAFGCLSEICLDAREIYLARPTPKRFSSFAGGLPLAGILLPAAFSTVLGMLAWRRYKSSLLTLVQLGVRRSDVLRSMVFGSFKRSIGNMISALLGIPLAALLISNLGAQYAGSEIIGLNIQWNYIGAILLSLILFPLLSGYLIFALAARRETMLKLKDQLSKFFDLRIIALGVIVVSVAQLARLGIGERSAVIYSNLLSVSMALGVIYPLSLLFLSRQKRKGGSSRIWTSLALGSSKQMLVQSFATAVIASFAVATFANILSLRNEDRVYYSDWPEKALIFDYGQLPNLSERQKYFEAINSVVSEPGIEVSLLNSKDVPLKFVSDLSTRGAIYSVKNVSDLERLFGEKLVPEAVTTLQNGGVLIGSNGYRYEEGQSGRAVVGERSGERREVDYFIQDIDPRWANGYGGFVLDEAFEKGDSFFSIPVFSVYPSSKALFDAAAAAVQNANLIPNVIQKEQGFQDLPLSRTLLIGLGSFMLLLITFNWASLKSLRNVLNSYANNFLTIGVPRALIWRSVFKVNAITAFFTLSAVATSALFIYVQVSLTYRPGIAEFPWVVLLALFVLLSTWTYVNSAMMAKKLEPTIAYSRGL